MLKLFIVLLVIVYTTANDIKANFKGNEYVEYKINTNQQVTRKDKVTLKFKTTAAYGVLLYSCGIQGDFLLLEIKRGKILYSGDFGSTYEQSGAHHIVLDRQYNDNKWHSVTLLRENGTHVYLTVDDVTKSRMKTDTDFEQLNLDTNLYVGGVGEHQRIEKSCTDIGDRKNFDGCMSSVRFNSIDLLYGANEKFTGYKSYGNLKFECNEKNEFNIFGFHTESSILKIKRNILEKNELNFTIGFRSFEPNGHIATHLCTNGGVSVDLVSGKVRLTLSFLATNDAVRIQSNIRIDDGDWHMLSVVVKRTEGIIFLQIDKDVHTYKFKDHFKLNKELGLFMSDIRFGGNTPELPGLVSCFRTIRISSKYVNFNSTDIILRRDVSDQCQVKDLCFPNPCQHGSTCSQSRSKYTCDCKKTEYKGQQCEKCVHKSSCQDLKASGETKSGYYRICPYNERIFRVFCNMETGATIIKHNIENDTRVADGIIIGSSTISFYMHNLQYVVSKEGIEDLLRISLSCKQYIRYDCYRSRLLFDVGRYRHVHFKGARWVSREAEIQHYWGGATPDSRKCGCGMTGTCAKDKNGRIKDCNCDVGDEKWRFDDGFLSDKSRLPVTQVQFSVGPETFDNSFFSVGHLQCYGEIPKPTTKAPLIPTTQKVVIPTEINNNMFFNLTKKALDPHNNQTIIVETIRGENIDSLFSRPWLITIVIVGAVLCLLLVFLMFLLFRQQVTDILIKCIYGNRLTKPRIEIEEYNRYSTATEENSDWDIYRLSTTFPTSTPEPSYCITDDESVHMRVRTLEDIRGKKKFKKLGSWGSRTVSAPTIVGSLKSLRSGKREKNFCTLEECKAPLSDCSSKPYETSSEISEKNESLKTFGSLETDQALSTTATDGERDSIIDTNSEFSHKLSNHSNDSSMKESECSSKRADPPKTLNINKLDENGKTKRSCSIPVTNYQKINGITTPPTQHRNGNTIYTDPIKAYYPILPINGFVHHRQPVIRRGHSVDYAPHMVVANPNGRYSTANAPRYIPVNRRQSTNSDHIPLFNHPTIQERSEESEEDENFPTRYSNGSDGFYELCNGEQHDSPTSETRLLFDDVNTREEVEREADEKIKLLKKKVIQKATHSEERL